MQTADYVPLDGVSTSNIPIISARAAARGFSVLLFLATIGFVAHNSYISSASVSSSSSAFPVPQEGIERVVVKPGAPLPASALFPLFSLVGPRTLFIYGNVSLPPELSSRLRSEAGYLYGARLEEGLKQVYFSWARSLAYPTGQVGDVVIGRLLSWPAFSFQSRLNTADKLHGFDPSRPEQGLVRRGIVKAIRKDGSSVQAVWYYQGKEQDIHEKAPNSEAEPVHFDGESFLITQTMLQGKAGQEAKQMQTISSLSSGEEVGVVEAAVLTSLICPVSFFTTPLTTSGLWPRVVAQLQPIVMGRVDQELREVKQELLKRIHGKVLDVGSGDGLYIKYFWASQRLVTELVLLEPNRHLHPRLERRVRQAAEKKDKSIPSRVFSGFMSELLSSPGEAMSYDSVVFGNVLCEIPDHSAALRDALSLLKDHGRIYFVEHITFPEGSRGQKMQDSINSFWRTLSNGCQCNKRTIDAFISLREEGLLDFRHWELRISAPAHLRRIVVGVAVKLPQRILPTLGQAH